MSPEDNPYAPPRSTDRVIGVRSGRREDLRAVAVAQKSILVCILLYFLCIIVQVVLAQNREAANYSIYVLIATLLVGLVATVSVFLLAIRVYSPVYGFFLGLGTFIPCVGIVILLMVNAKATRILRENGIHVGFMGADLSKF
jgi:hypothetical protein